MPDRQLSTCSILQCLKFHFIRAKCEFPSFNYQSSLSKSTFRLGWVWLFINGIFRVFTLSLEFDYLTNFILINSMLKWTNYVIWICFICKDLKEKTLSSSRFGILHKKQCDFLAQFTFLRLDSTYSIWQIAIWCMHLPIHFQSEYILTLLIRINSVRNARTTEKRNEKHFFFTFFFKFIFIKYSFCCKFCQLFVRNYGFCKPVVNVLKFCSDESIFFVQFAIGTMINLW